MVVCQKQVTVGRERRSKCVAGFRLIEASYEGSMTVPPHFHQQSNISMVLRGGLEERAAHAAEQYGPGSVVFKPAGTVHSNRFGDDGAATFIVELPTTGQTKLFMEQTTARVNARLPRYEWRYEGDVVGSMLRILERWRATEYGNDADHRDDCEIEEELLFLLSCIEAGNAEVENREPPWIANVIDFLNESATVTIAVADVAQIAGVHPVYLARVFRRLRGKTMHEYIHRIRTGRAARQLAVTSTPLSELALTLGFADQAHFCRIFKRCMGVAPGWYRRVIRG